MGVHWYSDKITDRVRIAAYFDYFIPNSLDPGCDCFWG